MSLAIDACIILILLVTAFKGWKRGLIRGVFGVVAMVVAVFGANLVSRAYSSEFVGMIEPLVSGLVDSAVSSVQSEGAPGDAVDVRTVSYRALRRLGVAEDAAQSMAEKMAADFENVGQVMADGLTQKLSQTLAFVGVFLVAFVILSILFAVLGNLVNFIFSLPGLALPDKILGLLFGLAKGLIIVLVIAVAMRYLGMVSAATIEKTKVLRYILTRNPLSGILGI